MTNLTGASEIVATRVPERTGAWFVPAWLDDAVALPTFEVIDTRSAQGRLDPRPKTVTIADLVLFHGHVCDGLLRSAYAFRALGEIAFPGVPFDRSDLEVVSKNSPCLGDVAAYLTGGRARFGTHLLDSDLGVGFVVRIRSTGATWEVREEAGFFPPLIARWEAALLNDSLVDTGVLSEPDKAELLAINEAVQWNWVRTALLPSTPADHYSVRKVDDAKLPAPIHLARRTDTANRDSPAPRQFTSPYEPGPDGSAPSDVFDVEAPWRQRYLDGPPEPR
jgi:formylmethanofuran dehydrogenase subunit E